MSPFGQGERGWSGSPAVDVTETDNAYEIAAELPGMDEKNIDVKFADGVLTIKGERQEEREEKEKGYHLRERSFGSFQRAFQVPEGVDPEKIQASFKQGLLTVTFPKTAESQKAAKKIEVKSG
jgi:HSP20 family protein